MSVALSRGLISNERLFYFSFFYSSNIHTAASHMLSAGYVHFYRLVGRFCYYILPQFLLSGPLSVL